MVFFSFLFFLIGILSSLFSPFFLLLTALPFSYLFFYRKQKNAFLFFLFTFIGFFLIFFYPKGTGDITSITGLVVSKKENYFLLLTWRGKFYISNKSNEITLLSFLTVFGKRKELSFTHYESIFDLKKYLESNGVFYEFQSSEIKTLFKNPLINTPIKNFIFSYLEEDSRIFVSSLLCGDSLYSLKDGQIFQDLGLASLFSLSGFHLGFFFSVLENAVPEKRKKYLLYIELTILLFFLFLSDYRYSIRRIFLLKLFAMISQKTRWKCAYIERLSLVAFLMLLFEPYSILSGSFYYPFPLLFTLSLFSSKREKNKKEELKSSLFIFLFYLPFHLFQNPEFHLLAPLLQLICLFISHFFFLSALLLFFLPQLGLVFNFVIHAYLKISSSTFKVPFSLCFGKPTILFCLLYYFLLFLFLILKQYHYQKFEKHIQISLCLLFSVSFLPDIRPHYEISFIDVGQGDSTLIRYENKNILIDTGGSTKVNIAKDCLSPFLKKKKITELDSVILTHTDYDHSGALDELPNYLSIRNVFYQTDFKQENDYQLNFGSLQIHNLNFFSSEEKDKNTSSGVYYFMIHSKSFLIMGDAPKEVETKILQNNPTLKADVIKVGHHGSNTSSDKTFLKNVSPSLAIISCGLNNSYKHPSKETLETLNSLKIPYRRTDIEGTITLKL